MKPDDKNWVPKSLIVALIPHTSFLAQIPS